MADTCARNPIGPRGEQTVPAWTPAELILLALRAGPMDSTQMNLRWCMEDIRQALSKLVSLRYVSCTRVGRDGAVYRITDAGLAACPHRNASAGLQREAA